LYYELTNLWIYRIGVCGLQAHHVLKNRFNRRNEDISFHLR
jgi:hypothetical protein